MNPAFPILRNAASFPATDKPFAVVKGRLNTGRPADGAELWQDEDDGEVILDEDSTLLDLE